MSRKSEQRLISGHAWDDFCDQLKAAGHIIDDFNDIPSDQDRAEWYRFLSRLTRNGFERFLENCEPERPRLRDAPWRQSINFQNPDQDHFLSEFIDGSHDYIIRGNRGTLPYFVIAVWSAPQPHDLGEKNWSQTGLSGLKEFDPSNLSTTSFLMSNNINFDKDENFEVIVSQKKSDGDWLLLSPDSTGILIRTVHHNREKEIAPKFSIERIDQPIPQPIRADQISEGLAKTAQAVFGYANLVRDWWFNNLSQRPNTIVFSEATYLSNGGVLDRLHGFGSWNKPKDQALVIEFTPPQCEFWILQICNIWQENLDCYENGQGYINKFTAQNQANGLVRAIISDKDTNIFGCNWINSYQHEKGTFSLRFIKSKNGADIKIFQVKLAELDSQGLSVLKGLNPIKSGRVTK